MTQDHRIYTAAVLIIGNEILSGRTRDANVAHLAVTLNDWGVETREVRVVPDVEAEIIAALNALRRRYDYVFTTGGIGPTHDDITADAVAQAFSLPLVVQPEALALLEAYYPPGELNAARRRMARVPEGADLIDNPMSKAPGFKIGNVFVLAGVPAIMRAQLAGCRPFITGGRPVQSRSLTLAVGEGVIAEVFEDLQSRHPHVEMGSYPFQIEGRYATTLVLRGRDGDLLAAAEAELTAVLDQLGVMVRETRSPSGEA